MSSTQDITANVAGLRGDDYINVMRGIAAEAVAAGHFLRCSYCAQSQPASLLGMHRCGQSGPPVCERHWREQQEWINTQRRGVACTTSTTTNTRPGSLAADQQPGRKPRPDRLVGNQVLHKHPPRQRIGHEAAERQRGF
jgi:hypothetical protein